MVKRVKDRKENPFLFMSGRDFIGVKIFLCRCLPVSGNKGSSLFKQKQHQMALRQCGIGSGIDMRFVTKDQWAFLNLHFLVHFKMVCKNRKWQKKVSYERRHLI